METEKLTSGGYFKSIKIIHFALIVGLVMFGVISIFLQLKGFGSVGHELNDAFMFIVPIFALGGIIGSRFMFNQKLKECRLKPGLAEKFTYYRSALIIKFALIEGSAFFAIVAYLLTNNQIFIIIAGVLVLVFLTYIPTKNKSITDLHLSHEEKPIIEDPTNEIR